MFEGDCRVAAGGEDGEGRHQPERNRAAQDLSRLHRQFSRSIDEVSLSGVSAQASG
jgi:hypothetical protein